MNVTFHLQTGEANRLAKWYNVLQTVLLNDYSAQITYFKSLLTAEVLKHEVERWMVSSLHICISLADGSLFHVHILVVEFGVNYSNITSTLQRKEYMRTHTYML